MFYFGSEMISTSLLNENTLDEIGKVKNFQKSISKLGLYRVYSDIHSFRDLLRSHLVMVMKKYKQTWGPIDKPVPVLDDDLVQVDEDALDLNIEEYGNTIAAQFVRLSVITSKLAQFFLTNSPRTRQRNSSNFLNI